MLQLHIHNPDYLAANIPINTLIELHLFLSCQIPVKTYEYYSHTTLYYWCGFVHTPAVLLTDVVITLNSTVWARTGTHCDASHPLLHWSLNVPLVCSHNP